MRQKSYLFLLLVLGLTALSAAIYSWKPYRYGLDIKGGIRFTYEMDLSKLTPEQRRDIGAIRQQVIQTLTRRATGPLGVVEPTVVSKGTEQIIVELPGLTDLKEAQEVMGTSARIEFYHAKNVATEKSPRRPYIAVDESESDNPKVSFRRRTGSDEVIRYGTDEYAKVLEGWDLILSGDELRNAEMQPSGSGYIPSMHFSPEGARKLEAWSRKYTLRGEHIAEVMDGQVLSIAPLREGAILSDNAVIEGEFSTAYVRNLVNILKSGTLPVDLRLQSSEKVDPTIGATALDKIILAGVVSFGITALFLIAYYSFPGFIALLALILYTLFTITTLKFINATFSLAAIGGFILSIGMAVDANILVFERFKEEMKRGRTLQAAIELGFRRALPAIVDSNACTILTSLVLANLGTGPVKGFATTLIIGVAISLFTAITVTRSLLMFFIGSGIANNPKWYAVERNWFGKKFEERAESDPLRIVQSSKKWFAISLAIMVIAVPFFFMGGFKPNVEFRGGYESVYALPEGTITAPEVAAKVDAAGFSGANVKFGEGSGGQRLVYITLPEHPELQQSNQQAIERVASAAGLDPASNVSFTQIGPAVQQETVRNAVIGVVLSTVLIVLYLAIRFGLGLGGFAAGLRFSFSSVGALVHDVVVVFGSAGILGYLFGWEISALFLTAMLTIIGFSTHDTIVIFDRIRENLHKPLPNEDFAHLVNRSVSQSFSRSINTSITIIATLFVLIFWGTTTPELKFFMAAMLIGILTGTYSSIYNASPILYLWDKAIEKKRGREHSLVGLAEADIARHRTITTQRVAEQAPQVQSTQSGRSYGQVRRRANQPTRGVEIEED